MSVQDEEMTPYIAELVQRYQVPVEQVARNEEVRRQIMEEVLTNKVVEYLVEKGHYQVRAGTCPRARSWMRSRPRSSSTALIRRKPRRLTPTRSRKLRRKPKRKRNPPKRLKPKPSKSQKKSRKEKAGKKGQILRDSGIGPDLVRLRFNAAFGLALDNIVASNRPQA